MANWGYDSFNRYYAWHYARFAGPLTWGKSYPKANGRKQSPIDIDTKKTKLDYSLPDLRIEYNPSNCVTLTNSGRSFAVSAHESGTNLSGGPLNYGYRLAQFHCHWGSRDNKGAEHTINGRRYAAEVHLVHWNTADESFGDAVQNDEGIAVLGAFLKVGRENPAWAELMPRFKEIQFRGDSVKLEGFDPKTLLPENTKHYWTYDGSLTTPPCYESVRFILFHDPVEISSRQLKQFRSLCYLPASSKRSPSSCKLVDNFRPCMPLNDRVVVSTYT